MAEEFKAMHFNEVTFIGKQVERVRHSQGNTIENWGCSFGIERAKRARYY